MNIPYISIGGGGRVRLIARPPSLHPLDIGGIEAAIADDPNPFPRIHLWRKP